MSVTSSVTSEITVPAVADWVKVFSKQAAETYTGSVTFMKQLTTVAVSIITYVKQVFAEENYVIENFGGLPLTILKKNCEDELAQFVSSALLQASDAFDKQYLHQLAICFYSGECSPENLVEYHIFEYSYTGDGASMNVRSKSRGKNQCKYTFQDVRKQTLVMIRTCLESLERTSDRLRPDSTDISFRLYYNDAAPAEYQAPGFSCPLEACDPLAAHGAGAGGGARLALGAVATAHHRLRAEMWCCGLDDSYEVNPTQNAPVLSDNLMDFKDESGLCCPCNKDDVDDTCAVLVCKYCGRGGHAACYGARGARAAAAHCCASCADGEPSRAPADPRLQAMAPHRRECLCVFRRTLWHCRTLPQLSAAWLTQRFQLSAVNAHKLVKLLQSHGVLATQDDDDIASPKQVIHEKLEQVLDKYFEKEDIVDRLLAETLRQENHKNADPVGDLLNPTDKTILRNEATYGQLIERTPPEIIKENSTLQQYREAILSNEVIEEELPLSGNHNPVKDIEKIVKKSAKRKADEVKTPRVAVKTPRVAVKTKKIRSK